MVNLHGIKRTALQKLAKEHGIKANMKNDEIIKELMKVIGESSLNLTSKVKFNEKDEKSDSNAETAVLNTPPAQKRGRKRGNSNLTSSASNQNPMKTSAKKSKRSQSNDPVLLIRRTRLSKENVINDIDKDLENEIMSEIRQRIKDEDSLIKETEKPSCIPRFRANGVTIKIDKTPGQKKWNKVHEKQFDKLESIDDYEKRKKERAKKLLNSNKRGNALSRLAKPVIRKNLKTYSPVAAASFMSPMSKRILAQGSIKKTPASVANKEIKFKPILTTDKMNLNFGQKVSKLSTPKRVTIKSARKSGSKAELPKTPHTLKNNQKSKTPIRTSTVKFTGSKTPGSIRKPAFDLQESLKKPLSWIPHKGPLKPLKDTQSKKTTFKDRMKSYKQPELSSRESRRLKTKENRENIKSKKMMSRRGISS